MLNMYKTLKNRLLEYLYNILFYTLATKFLSKVSGKIVLGAQKQIAIKKVLPLSSIPEQDTLYFQEIINTLIYLVSGEYAC